MCVCVCAPYTGSVTVGRHRPERCCAKSYYVRLAWAIVTFAQRRLRGGENRAFNRRATRERRRLYFARVQHAVVKYRKRTSQMSLKITQQRYRSRNTVENVRYKKKRKDSFIRRFFFFLRAGLSTLDSVRIMCSR